MNAAQIARICHEANRALCVVLNEEPQPHWDDAPPWMRDSAIAGVEYRIRHPAARYSAQHEQWMTEKLNTGWKHGPEKDVVLKTHPCLIPFDQLTREQQLKDILIVHIVNTLAHTAESKE